MVAVIDAIDLPLAQTQVWTYHQSDDRVRRGYVSTRIRGRRVYLHRIVLRLDHGDRRLVDHADRNGLNNTRANLRVCDHGHNGANSEHRKRISRHRGVTFTRTKRWHAAIADGSGGMRHLGTYDDEDDAGRAYDQAARERFGEFATLNFPEDHHHE